MGAPSAALPKGDGCFEEKHLYDWVVSWIGCSFCGNIIFYLEKMTNRQTTVIQTWRSGMFSEMKEVKLSLQEKLTAFVASDKIWPFKWKLNFGKLVSGTLSFTASQFLTTFLKRSKLILIIVTFRWWVIVCWHWHGLVNQYFQMTTKSCMGQRFIQSARETFFKKILKYFKKKF